MSQSIDLSEIEDLASSNEVWTEEYEGVWYDVRLRLSIEGGVVDLEQCRHADVRTSCLAQCYRGGWSWLVVNAASFRSGYRVDVGVLARDILADARLRDALAAAAAPMVSHGVMVTVRDRLQALAEENVETYE